jgi:hypothetical protein
LPVQSAVFSQTHILRSQNAWENQFLRLLGLLLNEEQIQTCFLADRGFRRVSFLKLLQEQKEHSFVVRMGDQIMVETQKWKRLLHRCRLQLNPVPDSEYP